MFSRRLLRAKALQYLYGYYMQQGVYTHNASTKEATSSTSKVITAMDGYETDLLKLLQQDLSCVQQAHRLTWGIMWLWAHPHGTAEPTRLAANRLLRVIWNSEICTVLPPRIPLSFKQQALEWYYTHVKPSAAYEAYNTCQAPYMATDKKILQFLLRETQLDQLLNQSLQQTTNLYQSTNAPALWHQLRLDVQHAMHEPDLLGPKDLSSKDYTFYTTLVQQTRQNRAMYQAYIQRYAPHWDPSHLLPIDELLLTLALCEMIHMPDIPPVVSINEYLALAKQYSMPKSYQFINGVLDRYAKDKTPSHAPQADTPILPAS